MNVQDDAVAKFPEIVFFFGAGASSGAGVFVPETPPLGSQLFGELKRCFPRSWGYLPTQLANQFEMEPLFERGMTILWNEFSKYVPQLMQHMCLYFVQFRAKYPDTILYDILLQEIAKRELQHKIALSTINYECLIEMAAGCAKLNVNYFSIPSDDNSIALWKLHGSCNFWPKGIRATRGVKFTRGVIFNTAILAHCNLNDSVAMCLANNALPPVMCLYMPDKPTQVAPESIAAIQKLWAESISNAKKVIIIGVAPNENDTHIWNPLKETNATIYYNDYDGRMTKWCQDKRKSKNSTCIGKDFLKSYEQMIKLLAEV